MPGESACILNVRARTPYLCLIFRKTLVRSGGGKNDRGRAELRWESDRQQNRGRALNFRQDGFQTFGAHLEARPHGTRTRQQRTGNLAVRHKTDQRMAIASAYCSRKPLSGLLSHKQCARGARAYRVEYVGSLALFARANGS